MLNRLLLLLMMTGLPVLSSSGAGLPKRLVIALDGVAYRDMLALQSGMIRKDFWGHRVELRAFTTNEGYFPVSRMISTFPSTSDVAWTEIFGDHPLPGYQRTYYSAAANTQIAINGVYTTMEHERQMNWQVQDGSLRTMAYLFPLQMFDFETGEMMKSFLNARDADQDYYVYIRASDDAQHMNRDIFGLLCRLDEQLQKLRETYKSREGRDLEIVILSDHGNNHAGRGKRVEVGAFLAKAGYRVARSLKAPGDVVLPTTGMESWVEIHNVPAETEKLAKVLTNLEGADLVAARSPDKPNHFILMNSRGERAVIEYRPDKNTLRYSAENGDPINYLPVVEALKQKHLLDTDGFATADDWMAETFTHQYPMALERIVRGLTRVTLNPATILISLKNGYVHVGWLVNQGSKLVSIGGTHGALDDLNSDGIVMSNFTPTHDTSSDRVADLFDGFPHVHNYRADEDGAELVTQNELALARIPRGASPPTDPLPDGNEVFLRVWTPRLAGLNAETPIKLIIDEGKTYHGTRLHRWDPMPVEPPKPRFILDHPIARPDGGKYERDYRLPDGLKLAPHSAGQISGWIHDEQIFEITVQTDEQGKPVAY